MQSWLRPPHAVACSLDQREVGEGLGEVSQVLAGCRVDLLGVEVQRAGEGQLLLAEGVRAVRLADYGQR
jgi:hypothetical protein